MSRKKIRKRKYSTKKNISKTQKNNRSSKRTRSTKISSSKNDFNRICSRYKLSTKFPSTVLNEIKKFSSDIDNSEYERRQDFKDQITITIDGDDAKDFDDAVYLRSTKNGYELFVHIADVSYYVREGTELDKEAFLRGNSVYLIDKAVNMLPQILSEKLCSLQEGVDRLTLSLKILLDKNAEIINYEFFEGIINVKKRLTYNIVERYLNKNKKVNEKHKDYHIYKMLDEMHSIAEKLKQKRIVNGSIDFITTEVKFDLDKNSKPIKVEKTQRLQSSKLIEEFMLLANQIVAEFLGSNGDTIYRIHESPSSDKLKETNEIINKLGYRIKNVENPDPYEFQGILNKASKSKENRFINILLLKSMKQACYHVKNIGHFGLNFAYYTHFTSPIRRYPDLIVHRLLRKELKYPTNAKSIGNPNYLQKVSKHTSKKEQDAVTAERDIIKIKSSRFMEDKINQSFKGYISGVTEFGIYVEVEPYGIEGLVQKKDIDKNFKYDEKNFRLMNEKTGEIYQIGDPIKVKLIKVNPRKKYIDFLIVE